jgi:hypothetical protein
MRTRIRKILLGNIYVLGIASLIWLIIRSGRKPSRLSYPCQRAALANTMVLFGGTTIPVAIRLPKLIGNKGGISAEKSRRFLRMAELVALVSLAGLLAFSLFHGFRTGPHLSDEMRAAAVGLALPVLRSAAGDASNIYVAEGIPANSERGVDSLIDIMGGNGLQFFKSPAAANSSGPDGIIGSNDIVLIKVNGEWRERGGTNTDVIKGIINAIIHHPDGFTGEIVIVENGQWDSYMDNRPDNQNPSSCNAEDHGQSFNDVAMMFAGSHAVSVYDWTAVQTQSVAEFSTGDNRDGYVYVPEIEEGYPKFTTIYGAKVSLRYGYWNGSSYDNDRVKFINVPVLKDHSLGGVTACIKHFMGVQDLYQGTQNPPHDAMINQGIFGKLMNVARFPDLNIVDAIWVTPAGGPNGPYANAVRLNRLLASRDPVALDYYCGKYVLMPISGNPAHDPNNASGNFHKMVWSTRDALLAGGKQVTTDEAMMNVYKASVPDVPPETPYEYFLAEGCTDYGFETWVLVANPNDQATRVSISYYTEDGPRNATTIDVPARSRLTVNASSTIWAKSSGIRVGADRPVYVERAMYWNSRVEGHSSIGTASGAGEWYLAEGCTDFGFETWVTILNPSSSDALVDLRFLTEKGEVNGGQVAIPALSRRNIRVNDYVSASNVSSIVSSESPVVAEVSLYGQGRRSGTCSMGVKYPAQKWYLAEGATHSGFDTWLLLLNPQNETANVTINVDSTGSRLDPISMELKPLSRTTLHLNDVMPGKDVSMAVDSDLPIVASRSMYWAVPGGRAGHESTGYAAPSTGTFLPEGCTDFGFDTWLLLYNPGDTDAEATVYGMTQGGEENLTSKTVPAHSRVTLRINDYYMGSLSLRVASDVPICSERATYWNNRGGGTCSAGYGI